MADDIPQYEFSAAEERLQRQSRRKAEMDMMAQTPTGQARAAKRAPATAFGAYEAQQARNAAAKTLSRKYSRPDR
jgi:hypothetical protein